MKKKSRQNVNLCKATKQQGENKCPILGIDVLHSMPSKRVPTNKKNLDGTLRDSRIHCRKGRLKSSPDLRRTDRGSTTSTALTFSLLDLLLHIANIVIL